jgi:hypothetical protein
MRRNLDGVAGDASGKRRECILGLRQVAFSKVE